MMTVNITPLSPAFVQSEMKFQSNTAGQRKEISFINTKEFALLLKLLHYCQERQWKQKQHQSNIQYSTLLTESIASNSIMITNTKRVANGIITLF